MSSDDFTDDALRHLVALIRIDTSNPPGREAAAAEYVAAALREAGLEPRVLEAAPGRANVVCRYRGTGELSPLLLNAHLDVVPADPAGWTHPPFSGELAGGFVWGRGAVDMKNMAAICLALMRFLGRERPPLRRDVIFSAVADEEAGSVHGAQFLVDRHPELVRAEHGIGEVGGFTLHILGRRFYPVMTAEKGVARVKLRARGEEGHGSMPHPETAIARLSRALERLSSVPLPGRLTPPMAAWLERVGRELPLPARWALAALRVPAIARRILAGRAASSGLARTLSALLADTAAPTVVRAGRSPNVLPASAEADLDCRTLPGTTDKDLLAALQRHVGPDCELELISSWPAVSVEWEGPLAAAIERALGRHDPEAVPVPYMIPGATDAKEFSRLGIKFFGFSPVRLPAGLDFSRLFHGVDERIPEDGFRWGARVLKEVVLDYAGQ